MAYRVALSRRAERRFTTVPRQVQIRLGTRIEALAGDPRPRGSERLSGRERVYRVRIGQYRILYQVADSAAAVLILAIGHRRDVFRHL